MDPARGGVRGHAYKVPLQFRSGLSKLPVFRSLWGLFRPDIFSDGGQLADFRENLNVAGENYPDMICGLRMGSHPLLALVEPAASSPGRAAWDA